MRTMELIAVIVVLGLGLSGCCHMANCCGKQSTKNSAGCMTVCSKCGMKKGMCKCGAAHAQLAEINTPALKTILDSGVPVTLVDARTGKFDDGRRISGALNLSPDATDTEIQGKLKDKNALIVSYCANLKCPASSKLAARLQMLGYKHVLEYSHGIEGWLAGGNPVTPSAK